MIKIIDTEYRTPHLVTLTTPFSSVCSVGMKPFWGTIEVVYAPETNRLIEFVSLEEFIEGFAGQRTTIEEVCRLVEREITTNYNPDYLKVTVRASTTVHGDAVATIQYDFGEKKDD